MFLKSLNWRTEVEFDGFPFDIAAIEAFAGLSFEAPVTMFVGENGSGKSTLIEAIACGMDCHGITASHLASDSRFEHARRLAANMRFAKARKPATRLLFRAEDATIFARHVADEQASLTAMGEAFDEELSGYGRMLARGAVDGQREALSQRYGEVPDARSHGEWFLTLLRERIHRPGLYLLDEPETPLSPIHQLSLLSMMMEAADAGAQFIVATHSPMIMACPGADLFELTETGVNRVSWQDVEHVQLLKSFLNDPDSYLRHL